MLSGRPNAGGMQLLGEECVELVKRLKYLDIKEHPVAELFEIGVLQVHLEGEQVVFIEVQRVKQFKHELGVEIDALQTDLFLGIAEFKDLVIELANGFLQPKQSLLVFVGFELLHNFVDGSFGKGLFLLDQG